MVIYVGIGPVLLLLFGFHILRAERAGKEPLLPSRLFGNPTTVLGLVTQNSQWFILIGMSFTLSVFLQVSRGLNAIETGLALTPATAGILIVDEVTRINRESRDRALGLALLAIAVVGTVGLLASLLMPSPPARAPDQAPPSA